MNSSPAEEQDAAAFLGHELDEVLHLRGAQEARVGIAEEDHIISEQLVLGRRERRQRRSVLLAVLGVGREQDDAQVDRFLAFEVVLQVAILVPGLAVDEQDLELLLANVDRPFEPVVLDLELAGLGLDFKNVGNFTRFLGPVADLDPEGLAVGRGRDLQGLEVAHRLGIGRSLVFLAKTDHDFLAGEAARQELGLEPDQVIDEDDVVDEQVGQLEVASRLGVAQADRVERHALSRGELGGLGQGLAVGGLAVAERTRIADGGAPRSSVRTCRTHAPRRVWPPTASTVCNFWIAGSICSGVSISASSRAEVEAR